MSTYSNCLAYDNIDCLLRIDGCIYLFAKAGDSDFQVTLTQIRQSCWGKLLSGLLEKCKYLLWAMGVDILVISSWSMSLLNGRRMEEMKFSLEMILKVLMAAIPVILGKKLK